MNVHTALLDAMAAAGDRPAQRHAAADGSWSARSHREVRERALRLAAALVGLGVRPGDRVGLVADIGPEWLAADLAVLAAGAADVPRGTESTPAEIGRALEHSGARVCLCVGEAALGRVLAAPGAAARLRAVVRLDASPDGVPEGVLSGAGLLDGVAPADPAALPEVGEDAVASIIYTSGTTGRPKGVTLLHRCFLHQVRVLPGTLDFRSEDLFLAMLPPWHCLERVVEYCVAAVGGEVAFTQPRLLKEHLPAVRPTWMATVPRVWEMVLALSGHDRLARRDGERAKAALRAALGGRLRCAVSGGGRMPDSVDRSYNEAGIRMLVGYGLTETAPVLTVRLPEVNLQGTIGRPIPETEIRVVDRESGEPLGPGEAGVIQARGPQVMRGYWNDPEATGRVLLPDGWFDTGDLGSLAPEGDLVFRGRAKDTLVLRGGENVEPAPLEERLKESPLVEQVVVVGADRKVLGALVVPSREAAAEAGDRGALEDRIREEAARLLTEQAGFPAHERISRVRVVPEPFTVENGLLTGTLKVRRDAVLQRYGDLVKEMYGESL